MNALGTDFGAESDWTAVICWVLDDDLFSGFT
jgi:hypothetical protein